MSCNNTINLCSLTSVWETETTYTLYYPSMLIPPHINSFELKIELFTGSIPLDQTCTLKDPVYTYYVIPEYLNHRTNLTVLKIKETNEIRAFIDNHSSFYMQLTDINHRQCINGPSRPNVLPSSINIGISELVIDTTIIETVNSISTPGPGSSALGLTFLMSLLGSMVGVLICFITLVLLFRKNPKNSEKSFEGFDGIADAPFDKKIEQVVAGFDTIERSNRTVNLYFDRMRRFDVSAMDPNNNPNPTIPELPRQSGRKVGLKKSSSTGVKLYFDKSNVKNIGLNQFTSPDSPEAISKEISSTGIRLYFDKLEQNGDKSLDPNQHTELISSDVLPATQPSSASVRLYFDKNHDLTDYTSYTIPPQEIPVSKQSISLQEENTSSIEFSSIEIEKENDVKYPTLLCRAQSCNDKLFFSSDHQETRNSTMLPNLKMESSNENFSISQRSLSSVEFQIMKDNIKKEEMKKTMEELDSKK